MTQKRWLSIRSKSGYIYGGIAFFLLFILLLLLRNPSLAIEQVKAGITLCSQVIIPSLFPFLVLSELFLLCGIDRYAARILRFPMEKLFRLPGCAGSALILGGLCGYPVGARIGAAHYDEGKIDGDTLSFLLMFCNTASPAFLIGTVGTMLWGEQRIGIVLCAIQILSSALIGIWFARSRPMPAPYVLRQCKVRSGLATFPQAFVRGANGMLSVCAYVIFFSAVIGTLDALPWRGKVSTVIKSFLFGFFEISSGMNAAASLPDPHLGFVLSALFMGWSGLSVHGQIATVTANRGVFYCRYFGAKALQAVLCAGMAAIFCLFHPNSIPAPSTAASLPTQIFPLYGNLISAACFGAVWLGVGWRMTKEKKNEKIT